MIINNKTKGVIVLKAVGMQNLRLFPGFNTVEEEGLKGYFKGKAALAHQKRNLAVVKSDEVTAEEKKLADKAQKKNERLNKAQRVVKAQNEILVKNDKTISAQTNQLKEQSIDLDVAKEKQEEQEGLIKEQAKSIKELQAGFDKLQKEMKKK